MGTWGWAGLGVHQVSAGMWACVACAHGNYKAGQIFMSQLSASPAAMPSCGPSCSVRPALCSPPSCLGTPCSLLLVPLLVRVRS